MTRVRLHKYIIAVSLISSPVKYAYSVSPIYGVSQNAGIHVGTSLSFDAYFQHTDFSRYVGHTVGEFLDSVPFKARARQGYDEPPGKLAGVRYEFPGGYIVKVETGELEYTKRFDEKRQWNLDRFSKEKITGIAVHRFGEQPFHKNFGRVYGAGPQ